MEFKLPELGENVHHGTVVRVMVEAGKPVKKDQAVMEVETDKAAIEVPSTVEGLVEKVLVKAGDKVEPGQTMFTVGAAEAAQPPAPQLPTPTVKDDKPAPQAPPKAVEKTADVLPAVSASPAVRKFAREIGVDLSLVPPGPDGLISMDDVKNHARSTGARPAAAGPSAPALPDFAKWGPVERAPMSSVRRATAAQMAVSWTAPHVTQYDRTDITEFEALRKQHSQKGVKLTVTALSLKIVAAALRHFPQFNAALDLERGEIVQKKYTHIGVAVDTERGLLVPVIRDVDKKSVLQLATELAAAADRARAKKLTLDEMQGGCFTITNLGGIGGTHFSPIVNWPEVAILGLSRSSLEPVYRDGVLSPRLILPLSLSYDHRAIDGADGARFLRWVAEAFEKPLLLAFEGMI